MELSAKDNERLAFAKQIPAEILAMAAKHQADNNMLSEAHCREIAGKWNDAAEVAAKRRTTAMRKAETANRPEMLI